MKHVYAVCVMAVLMTIGAQANLSIDMLLSDENQFQQFVTCFLETAPCSDLTASFKKDIPDTLLRACEKCSPEQKYIAHAFIVAFKKRPQHYQAFKQKYDPENIYLDKLEAAVSECKCICV